MTTKQDETMTLTDEQLDAVAGGYIKIPVIAVEVDLDVEDLRDHAGTAFRRGNMKRRSNRTAWGCGWLGRGF